MFPKEPKTFIRAVIHKSFIAILLGICRTCAGQEGYRFLTTPGTFLVLEDTTALFNWTHNINTTRIAIIWEYKGSGTQENHERSPGHVLQYSGDRLFQLWNNANYIHRPWSAIMTLDQVSQKEAGKYYLRVTDVALDTTITIYDTATLVVISDLQYNVTIGGQTFVLSVEKNGTDVMLPEADLLVPARLPVTISVISSAPVPDIQINSVISKIRYTETPCAETYICERRVPFFKHHAQKQQIMIECTLDFTVQNVKVIHVKLPISLRTEDSSPVVTNGAHMSSLETNQTIIYSPSSSQAPVTKTWIGWSVFGAVVAVFVVSLNDASLYVY